MCGGSEDIEGKSYSKPLNVKSSVSSILQNKRTQNLNIARHINSQIIPQETNKLPTTAGGNLYSGSRLPSPLSTNLLYPLVKSGSQHAPEVIPTTIPENINPICHI